MKNAEIISFETRDGKLYALLSYQTENIEKYNVNNGFDTIEVPVNLRPLQYSPRGNILVNQSITQDVVCKNV